MNTASAPLPDLDQPLRSIHTQNFPALLNQVGGSLVVSTYQAGKLIVIRSEGEALNTHFRVFKKPMGLAVAPSRLAIGSGSQIWITHNVPATAAKLKPAGRHDACYIPRSIHTTGDIDIHEMGFGQSDLWFVNTRFSCLCTLDLDHSFVPRWRPPFVSAYAPEDRCHLNGLGMVNGQPKYVTALGQTDTPRGWRQNKANGGLLMDIDDNRIVSAGLSMPHSPRWYRDQLWVLESGRGSLSKVDIETGTVTSVATLPGFTRGLTFAGPLAFVGLSQVRETATFSGIPITEQLTERTCGVWVINIETSETVAFLKFEEAVQEIFSVELLSGVRFPEVINEENEFFRTSYVLPDAALKEVAFSPVPLDDPLTCLKLGNQAYQQQKLAEAENFYRRCLKREPALTQARYHLGLTLLGLEQWQDAQTELQQVINEQPNHAAAHNTLGMVLFRQNLLETAIEQFEHAIAYQPNFAQAHMNLGMALLSLGNFAQGFAEYEWRWQTPEFKPIESNHPVWDGSDLSDKTILIHAEQGAGDTLQFIRFVPLMVAKAKRVLLVAPDSLLPLFAQIPGLSGRLKAGTLPNRAFDTYVPLMSLPHRLGLTRESMAADIPYLKAEGTLQRGPFGPLCLQKEGLSVGLVWAGHADDSREPHRSCDLEAMRPLLSVSGVTFYRLPPGPGQTDLAVGDKTDGGGDTLHDVSAQILDWADMARVLDQLDLVITVDTGVAHLAGAMGKSTWILLRHVSHWRWMLDRDDSPWYPTVRLFRQEKLSEWASVIDNVTAELSQWVAHRGS